MIQTPKSDLQSRISHESELLDREFRGRVPAEVVNACIRTAESRIADVPVPDFAPIFFARHVRRLLREFVDATADRAHPA